MARQPASGHNLSNGSSPDIPVPCYSPPSSSIKHQRLFLILSSNLSGLPIDLRPSNFPSSTCLGIILAVLFIRIIRPAFYNLLNFMYCLISFPPNNHRALLCLNFHPKSFPKSGPNILCSAFL
jgi:hypothetical protein